MRIRSLAARAASFLVLVLAAIAASPAAAQTLAVGDANATCGGSSFSVPIRVNNASGMLSLEFRVSYDNASMTFNSAAVGSLTTGFTMSSNATSTQVVIAMASGSPTSGSGTAVTLTFTPKAGAAAADIKLTPTQIKINDVAATGTFGTVHMTCAPPPPPAPQAPALTSPADGAKNVAEPVRLRWSAATNAASYRVYLGTSSNPGFLVTDSDTSRTVETNPGTRYFWRVRAVNESGTADSPIFSFTTAGEACNSLPSPQLSAARDSVASGTPIQLSWPAVAGATDYLVEEANNVSFSGATSTATTSTSFSVTRSVASESTFFFRVRARAATACNGQSDPSTIVAVRVTTQATPPPVQSAHGFLVVVGSGPGANGSFFRTAVQLHNPTNATMLGRLVFHPVGVAGSASDPSLPYSLPPHATRSYADIVTSLGTTGFGSLDIVVENDPASVPLTAVRIFNDSGAAGSTGMNLERLTAADALPAGKRTVLLAPTQPSAMRLNIGVRTLEQGATLRFTVLDKLGAAIGTLTRTFPATYFEQFPLSAVTANLAGDEVVVVDADSGSALVYGATTDNLTQDPAIQIGRPVE